MTKTLLSSQRKYFRPSRISLWTFFIQPSNGNTLNQWRILMITDLQCFEKHGMYNAMGSYQTIYIIFSIINKDYKMENEFCYREIESFCSQCFPQLPTYTGVLDCKLSGCMCGQDVCVVISNMDDITSCIMFSGANICMKIIKESNVTAAYI